MGARLSSIGTDADPTFDDLVAQAVTDEAFVAACGPLDREARTRVARAALLPALLYLGLFLLIDGIEHDRCGHA